MTCFSFTNLFYKYYKIFLIGKIIMLENNKNKFEEEMFFDLEYKVNINIGNEIDLENSENISSTENIRESNVNSSQTLVKNEKEENNISNSECKNVEDEIYIKETNSYKHINKDISGISMPEEIKNKIINESVQALKRSFIENGNILCVRNTDGGVVKINNLTNIGRVNFYRFLKRGYLQRTTFEIPKCLYNFKDEIIVFIKKMGRESNSVIYLDISSNICISIFGREKDVNKCYINSLKYIQHLFNYEFKIEKGYFNFRDNYNRMKKDINDNEDQTPSMLYFGSRIDNNTILVSRYFNLISTPVVHTVFRVDSAKYFFLLQYDILKIENILNCYSCYLETNIKTNKITEFKIIGFDDIDILKCKNKILMLFFEINKLIIPLEKVSFVDKALFFKYKNTNTRVVVGYQITINQILINSKVDCNLQVELNRELEDFLCGKKNGKVNKIIKETGCSIVLKNRLKDSDEIYFLISGWSTNVSRAIELLKLEYPEKLAFFLHEKHHKRIIGFGGKNIQKIMKKHGVYIKFMGEDEKKEFGYNGNVIIKTPRKNISSLEKMKNEILLLADEKIEEKSTLKMKRLPYFDFFDFNISNYKLEYKYVTVQTNLNTKPRYMKIFDKDNETPGDIVLKLRDGSIFIKRYGKVQNEVNSINWCTRNINNSFGLFNGNLFHKYEPFFYTDKTSDENIEFRDRDKNDISVGSTMTVGFQDNKEDNKSMK
ncbi:KH domain containing protein [Spraguea lophii 42_110]|uniref:KH domain containing protein n=1 Tax=Spraguea lophii (strain 42_110) TaxID=1358809 RepID=S7XSV5_SPRLO|nr:KH domain containing protein [Spraguea lophii 42_110]